MLEDGDFGGITELAAAEKIDRSYLCRVLRLTLVAPDLVKAIMDRRPAGGCYTAGADEGLPAEWER
jgi:hypothetical protein